MRSHGLLESPRGIGANGHACWGYDGLDGDFHAAAVAFLAEGRELGQALMFVGGPATEELVRSVEPTRSMVSDGSLQIAPFDAVYPGGRRMPNGDQWTAYAAATADAREAGFTGLRVLADVTELAKPAGASQAQAQWETYADRRMAGFTLSALCCFDTTALSPEELGRIASAHPVVDRRLEELVPFRLFARGDALVIAGEVDAFSSATLRLLLHTGDGVRSDHVLDLSELTFIDHTGMRVLHEYAAELRARGLRLTLRDVPSSVHRLADLLEVTW